MADIEKLATFDGRIVQRRPVYAVQKGALSVTNAPFNAIAATSSQHTYNIYVPSENVFVDRALEWSSTVALSFQVAVTGAIAAGDSIVVPGRDFALAAFPLNSLCSTMSATINDTTAVINTQDVLYQVLRLADQKRNRLMRTCPTMLDKYQSYDDAFGTLNNPIAGYEGSSAYDEVPNGAFQQLIFTSPTGAALGTASPAFAGANYDAVNGIPVYNAAAAAGPYTIYIQWRSTEKLVLSPFVFADQHEMDTGLFGINNIQLIMNMNSSPARVIRSTGRAGRAISAVAYPSSNVFTNSRINVTFLTPSLDVPLPPKSVVPYMEFPRYLSNPVTVAAGTSQQLQSQTITLPQIPDLLIIYARPTSYSATEGDWVFPVQTSRTNDVSPISINFDNFSGLLSSVTSQQLYFMSVKNGLEQDWNSWSGLGHTASGSYPTRQQGQIIPLVGGALVLKPGQDITLQSGQAPSLVGNFTLQFNLTVTNPTLADRDAQLVVITVNSGFFESIRGSSRIIKGVLSEQDIISAPLAPMGAPQLDRLVGGFSFSSLANVLSKAKDFYERSKPAISALKGALPEDGVMGKVKGALGAVGYGAAGGAVSGGAMSGGRRHKMSLAERLA
jgi:hypothetical protein